MEWSFDMSIEDMMLNAQEDNPKTVDESVVIEIKKIVEVFTYLLISAIYLSSKESGHKVMSSSDILLGCERAFKILKGGK
jgi:hypothetical protein